MRHSARGTTKEGGVYMERRRGRSKALFGRRILVRVIGRAQTRGWAAWQPRGFGILLGHLRAQNKPVPGRGQRTCGVAF